MKPYATMMVMKLIRADKDDQIKLLKANLQNKEFMELIYLGYHTGIDFRLDLPEYTPRPQIPENHHKTFFRLAMDLAKNPFDETKGIILKEFILGLDGLSQYIYAKVINKTLGLSRDILEKQIPGLIEKEPYSIIKSYGSPTYPCYIQCYNKGTTAIVTIGDLGVTRDINLMKDIGGAPISGFEMYIARFKRLGLKGSFVVELTGDNEEVFLARVKGDVTKHPIGEPIVIIDYIIQEPFSIRQRVLEATLLEKEEQNELLRLSPTVYVESLDGVLRLTEGNLGYNAVVAKQDVLPILREEGNHAIDLSYLI